MNGRYKAFPWIHLCEVDFQLDGKFLVGGTVAFKVPPPRNLKAKRPRS